MRFSAAFSLLVAGALVAVVGCGDDDTSAVPGSTVGSGGAGGGGAGVGGTEIPDPMPISAKATVKLKTRYRLLGDLGQALSLEPDELCLELGLYDCGSVHSIALSGVDAYGAGVYRPLATSAATSPIAVDRIVLSACQTRAYRDLVLDTAGQAVFVGLEDGTLDAQSEAVTNVITTLYRRGHLRDPKPSEIDHLRQLYLDIAAAGGANPARDWATLSCYAVLTTLESVFY